MEPKSTKPRLLFISPVLPSPEGPGLAMRPYYQMAHLSQRYSLHLLVAESFPANSVTTAHIESFCYEIDYLYRYRYSEWKLKPWRLSWRLINYLRHFIKGDGLSSMADSDDRQYLRHHKALTRIAKMKFDRVHVFRLYLNPIAEILKELGLSSFYSLDIDDIESETRKSISELFFHHRDFIQAFRLRNESTFYFNTETKVIPGYDQIFTCSRHDKETLQNRFPGKEITVLPNVTAIPPKARSHKPNQVLTILFVGTMGYFPNMDAVLFFAEKIVPILRQRSRQPWQLRVVGKPPKKKWSKKLKYFPEIKLSGFVKDLYPEYEAADIVIAPIRGGGGTRIKILEAFAHGVPVVSTPKGVEGLDVENGVHLLIEDDPGLFADACIRLMNDQPVRDEISRRAFNLAVSKYSPEMINRIWTEPLPDACRS